MEVKQQRLWELHLLINNVSDFFAMLDNSFQALEEHVLSFCVIDKCIG